MKTLKTLRTPFNRKDINVSGEYVHLIRKANDKQFIGRFRKGSGGSRKFISFLIKNFTIEEYFALLEDLPPLKVLETKGYISPNMTKLLKLYGLPITQDGIFQMNIINNRRGL